MVSGGDGFFFSRGFERFFAARNPSSLGRWYILFFKKIKKGADEVSPKIPAGDR